MHSLFGGIQKSLSSFMQFPNENESNSENLTHTDGLADINSPNSDDIRNKKMFEQAGINPSKIADKIVSFAKSASDKVQNKAALINSLPVIKVIEEERLRFRSEIVSIKDFEASKWEGLISDPSVQSHILTISQNKDNFLQEPPIPKDTGMEFIKVGSVATQLLKLDQNLAKMRFELVPKQISEDHFWRNYAYRLSLIEKLVNKNKNSQDDEETKQPLSSQRGANKNWSENGLSDETVDEELEKELLSDFSYEMIEKKEERSDENWEDEIDDILKDESSEKTGR